MTKNRGCTGKIRHETRAAADKHLGFLRRIGGVRMQVCKCNHCHGWHVGHIPRRRR
ncbi:hypothetical protein ACU686_37745 [Yinghuangia aomiensis]